MPRIHIPTFRYTDPTLTAPQPGRALIFDVGLVESLPGRGPKSGGQDFGIPLAVGPKNTRLRRLVDGADITRPNTDLQLWTSPFYVAAHAHGIFQLAGRDGWHWLQWTIADHVHYDQQTTHDNTPATDTDPPLVIVPCGATKAASTTPVPAGRLYTGTYHRLGLRAAAALTGPESTRILSGKHGLLRLDDPVAPYNLRLGHPDAVTADTLTRQARTQQIHTRRHVVVLGGRDYTRLALQVWPHAVGSGITGDHSEDSRAVFGLTDRQVRDLGTRFGQVAIFAWHGPLWSLLAYASDRTPPGLAVALHRVIGDDNPATGA